MFTAEEFGVERNLARRHKAVWVAVAVLLLWIGTYGGSPAKLAWSISGRHCHQLSDRSCAPPLDVAATASVGGGRTSGLSSGTGLRDLPKTSSREREAEPDAQTPDGGAVPAQPEGTPCAIPISSCDAECGLQYGGDPQCELICCATTNVHGTYCSGKCIDLSTDSLNCGTCGRACPCKNGECTDEDGGFGSLGGPAKNFRKSIPAARIG